MSLVRPSYLARVLPLRTSVRSGLLGWWPLNDSNVINLAGNGLGKGTINGSLTSVDGRDSFDGGKYRAISFPGTATNFISIANGDVIANSVGAASWCFWINNYTFNTAGGTNHCVIGNDNGSTSAGSIILSKSSGDVGAVIYSLSGGDLANSTKLVNDGFWHHCVVVRTGSTGSWTINFYIDGLSAGSGTTATNPTSQAAGNLSIGRIGSFNGYYVPATLQDVRFYNRALLAQEAHMIYSEAFPSYATFEAELLTASLPPGVGTTFRRTFSQHGTRTHSRQIHAWNWSQ